MLPPQVPDSRSPIVKCSHCKQILSAETFDSHNCDMPLIDVKRIPVIYFQDASVNGEKIMIGRGTDGILYSFVVTPRMPIPYMARLSDGFLHRKPSDKDLTESIQKTLINSNLNRYYLPMTKN